MMISFMADRSATTTDDGRLAIEFVALFLPTNIYTHIRAPRALEKTLQNERRSKIVTIILNKERERTSKQNDSFRFHIQI